MKYPVQKDIADALRRFNYYSWVNEFRNSSTMVSVPKAAPTAPPQAAPPAAARQGGAGAGAFAAPQAPEPPFEEEPAAAAPAAVAQKPVAPAPAPAPVAAPKVQAAPQPAPVQAAPPPAPVQVAPAQVPAAKPAAQPAAVQQTLAGQASLEGRLQTFSTNTGVPLNVNGTTYPKPLRMYRADLAVPNCWSTYSVTTRENRELCKACPVRLDCMMIS